MAKLDTTIEKLGYKLLKLEWSAKTTRAKIGSGLHPDEELNPDFAESHEPLNLASSSMDTSFVNELSQCYVGRIKKEVNTLKLYSLLI